MNLNAYKLRVIVNEMWKQGWVSIMSLLCISNVMCGEKINT